MGAKNGNGSSNESLRLVVIDSDAAMRTKVKRWVGAKGIRVTDPAHVEEALQQGLAATQHQPALVEVMVAERPYPKI